MAEMNRRTFLKLVAAIPTLPLAWKMSWLGDGSHTLPLSQTPKGTLVAGDIVSYFISRDPLSAEDTVVGDATLRQALFEYSGGGGSRFQVPMLGYSTIPDPSGDVFFAIEEGGMVVKFRDHIEVGIYGEFVVPLNYDSQPSIHYLTGPHTGTVKWYCQIGAISAGEMI